MSIIKGFASHRCLATKMRKTNLSWHNCSQSSHRVELIQLVICQISRERFDKRSKESSRRGCVCQKERTSWGVHHWPGSSWMRPHRLSVHGFDHRMASRKKKFKRVSRTRKGGFIVIDNDRMYRSSFVVDAMKDRVSREACWAKIKIDIKQRNSLENKAQASQGCSLWDSYCQLMVKARWDTQKGGRADVWIKK